MSALLFYKFLAYNILSRRSCRSCRSHP